MDNRNRWCFFIPQDPKSFDEGLGWVPSVAHENMPGHFPCRGNRPGDRPYYWGMTHEEASRIAEKANADMGISPEDAKEIVNSSIMASIRQRGMR